MSHLAIYIACSHPGVAYFRDIVVLAGLLGRLRLSLIVSAFTLAWFVFYNSSEAAILLLLFYFPPKLVCAYHFLFFFLSFCGGGGYRILASLSMISYLAVALCVVMVVMVVIQYPHGDTLSTLVL